MRILEADLKHNSFELIPECFEDLHFLGLFIKRGDHVYSWSSRHVKPEREGGKRPDRGNRLRVYLGIEVEDTEISGFRGALRVRGRIIEAPEWLPVKGRYHTLTVGMGTRIRIIKQAITNFEIKRLKRLSKRRERVLIVSVDYDEATIALLHDAGVEIIERRSTTIPGKREVGVRDQAITAFLKSVAENVLNLARRENVKNVIIAGPGLAKTRLHKILSGLNPNLRIFVEDVTSSDESGVYEVIRRGAGLRVLRECELAEAQRALEEALARIGRGNARIAYGIDEVQEAAEMGAVDILVVGEVMLKNPAISNRLVSIMELVDEYGGKVLLLSPKAELYPTLRNLGGIVALLRYAIKAT